MIGYRRPFHAVIALLRQIIFTSIVLSFVSVAAQSQDQLVGVTYLGGEHGVGTIITTDAAEINLQLKRSFRVDYQGSFPETPVVEINGRLFGTTQQGESGGNGLLYSFDPQSRNYRVEAFFDGITTGKNPLGRLTALPNGKIYGMTSSGAQYGLGAIFEFDPTTQILSKKIAFDTLNGGRPRGGLMLAADAKLYGMTSYGGNERRGVIFSYAPETNAYTKLKDLSSTTSTPYGDLIEVSEGRMFGTCLLGGTKVRGAVFEFDPLTSKAEVIVDFQGGSSGSSPSENLLLASNGKLYGTASGGSYNSGLIFELNLSDNSYSKVFDFDYQVTGSPVSSLIEATNGKFYGLTLDDMFKVGLFEFDPVTRQGKLAVDFETTKGSNAASLLMQASNGKLYGTCLTGGAEDGMLFEYDITTDHYAVVVNFSGSSDGLRPRAALAQGLGKKVFGTTEGGGAMGKGIIFSYDLATDEYEKKLEFESYPGTGLLFNRIDGNFYGYGSEESANFLFAYHPTTNLVVRKTPFSGTDFGSPEGMLVQSPEGRIFGVTRGGGANNVGVLFEYDVENDVIVKKFDFDGSPNGANGTGYLVIKGNSIFGTTSSGGQYGSGVLFEYDFVQGAYAKRIDFHDYRSPTGALAIAPNDRIYGVTASGGSYNGGAIYEYDPATHNSTLKIELRASSSEDAGYPRGGLTVSSNGKIYGMMNGGGPYNKGSLFEYDYLNNEYKTITPFSGENGASPEVPLLLVTKGNQVINFPEIPAKRTTDPPFALSAESTSGLPISYTSSNPDVATIDGQTVTIVGEGSTVITASQPGDDIYHPAFDKTQPLIVSFVVSIEERDITGVSAYPNPARTELIIESADIQRRGIRLTDVLGKTYVLEPELRFNDYQYKFDISTLRTGLYILQLPSKPGKMRIMIQR